MRKKTIVLASGNLGKAKEFRAVLEPLGYEIILQKALGIVSPAETGKSFLENAILKARYASEKSGFPALADDSGLCVDYLNGAPGIFSARFAGKNAGCSADEANNRKLLELMKDVPDCNRTARYWCALCLVCYPDDPVPYTVMGSWEGSIGYEPLGQNGFGYDPLFRVAELGMTAAQLPTKVKNKVSHRGLALKRFIELLSADEVRC